MYCALCKNKIDKEHPFTDKNSHKPTCPIYATDKQVVDVIKGKWQKAIMPQEEK